MAQIYGDGGATTGNTQFRTHYYYKKALIDIAKDQYFTPLADVRAMPKNFGKTIKQFHYIPLLDDRNVNDEGIDAAGAVITPTSYQVVIPRLVQTYAVEADATAAAAAINAVTTGVAVKSGAATPWTVTATVTNLGYTTQAKANAVLAAVPGTQVTQGSGNLYGSSKDIGTISAKLPVLSETGGRVNRVGYKRVELEGSIEKFGLRTALIAA